ncbi:hypothetical protein FKM82_022809 [Ascaphus truei]
MDSADLEDLCSHVNSKISIIKKTLHLRNIGQDPSLTSVLSKVAHEMYSLHDLLNKVEKEVRYQESLTNSLKELQGTLSRDFSEATHLTENIPAYLPKKASSRYIKNRLTYDQINSIIEEINKAVVGKYKILHQPMKSLSNNAKKLLCRFKDEETKDTKGQFFIVDQDIKEFTQVKIDKRFHGMLSILRHCHRIREIRGKGLVRYTVC